MVMCTNLEENINQVFFVLANLKVSKYLLLLE